jgi:hypothetical protein
MGHPGLLIQDYVAGIPIWYIPNNQSVMTVNILTTDTHNHTFFEN